MAASKITFAIRRLDHGREGEFQDDVDVPMIGFSGVAILSDAATERAGVLIVEVIVHPSAQLSRNGVTFI